MGNPPLLSGGEEPCSHTAFQEGRQPWDSLPEPSVLERRLLHRMPHHVPSVPGHFHPPPPNSLMLFSRKKFSPPRNSSPGKEWLKNTLEGPEREATVHVDSRLGASAKCGDHSCWKRLGLTSLMSPHIQGTVDPALGMLLHTSSASSGKRQP